MGIIEKTNNFKRISTWIKRVIVVLLVIGLTFNFESIFNMKIESIFIYILITAIIFLVIVARENDIAVDEIYFYHIKTSKISCLSKITKYEIYKIESIRWKGFDSEIYILFGRRSLSGLDFGIEITFRDKTSVSLDINMLQKDMDRVLRVVKKRIDNNKNV